MTDLVGSQPPSNRRRQGSSALRDALENPERAPLFLYDVGLDESTVSRMWNEIQDPGGAKRPFVWTWPALWAATTCVVLFSVFSWLRQPQPLALASEQQLDLGQVVASEQAERTLAFSDGSEIILQEESELSVLSNEGTAFVTALRSGQARFSVTPGGPRRWMVDAGELSVEVVGTVFVVERNERGTRVEVERGKVLVTGNVAGGRVTLTAGEQVEARASSGKSNLAPENEDAVDPLDAVELDRETGEPRDFEVLDDAQPRGEEAAQAEVVTLEQLEQEEAQRKSSQEEAATLESRSKVVPSSRSKPRDLARLLAQADEAKARGDGVAARAAYLEVVQESEPGDPRRGIAAMSYARLNPDASELVEVLRSSLSSMPGALRESAWLRLVRAQQALGDVEGARASAQRYLSEFPQGSRRRELEDLVTLE